jgi:hypothetical protein
MDDKLDDDYSKLDKIADLVSEELIQSSLAEKKFFKDERIGREYYVLSTPDAFKKKFVGIGVLGYPEKVGVWSYTLLKNSKIEQSSMKPYFQSFLNNNWGFIAINPNYFQPDLEGETFKYQLNQIFLNLTLEQKIGLIGFSMGGKIIIEFLNENTDILNQVIGLALIDPTLPNRLHFQNISRLIQRNTLLIASISEFNSPGDIASVLLNIPKKSFEGIHGEIPNKSLSEIIKFYLKRLKDENKNKS